MVLADKVDQGAGVVAVGEVRADAVAQQDVVNAAVRVVLRMVVSPGNVPRRSVRVERDWVVAVAFGRPGIDQRPAPAPDNRPQRFRVLEVIEITEDQQVQVWIHTQSAINDLAQNNGLLLPQFGFVGLRHFTIREWRKLDDLNDVDAFSAFVGKLRARRKIRNDDVTLVCIEGTNSSLS